MPKFFKNDRHSIVDESLVGHILLSSFQNTTLLRAPDGVRVVVRKDWDPHNGLVSLISGGGSGHEPAHAGFVGKGMLTAAVCGQVFASPSVEAILAAIIATTGDAGALLLVKNYTGDRLNFGLAAERARNLGYNVSMVIIDDDIALEGDVQARGIAGTALVHKVAGHHAQNGASLNEVVSAAKHCISRLATIGVAMSTCTTPTSSNEERRIKEGSVELGLGIHGEPGAEIIDFNSTHQLVNEMLERIIRAFSSHDESDEESKYAILINNLGGVSPLEMSLISKDILSHKFARQAQLVIGPSWFVTSLDMKGFSVSYLLLDESLCDALTSEVEVDGWKCPVAFQQSLVFDEKSNYCDHDQQYTFASKALEDHYQEEDGKKDLRRSSNPAVRDAIHHITEMLIRSEKELNDLDQIVGDGDAGSTFATGAEAIKVQISEEKLDENHISHLFQQLGDVLSVHMGGSSGVLLSILLTAAGRNYDETSIDSEKIAMALLKGVEKIKLYGGAKEGQRTMIDALQPALIELSRGGSLQEAAKKARDGAESTKEMTRAMGRSGYLNVEQLRGHMDPGAEIIARIFETLADTTA